jgi:hypothetical protein
MTAPELRKEPAVTIAVAHVPTLVTEATETTHATEAAAPAREGETRALLAVRLLASLALFVAAVVHARLALHAGFGGPLFARGHLFALHAVLSAVLAFALLARGDRVWLVAVVLSLAGLGAILASVYAPVPAVGPLPSIDEPAWLVSKAVVAFSEITVIALWLIRQIAPPRPRG